MHPSLPRTLGPFLWHFLKPYKYVGLVFIVFSMVTGLWAVFNSLLIKTIIDALGKTPGPTVGSDVLWPAVLFLLNFEVHNLSWRAIAYINYRFQPVIKNQIISETFGYVHRHTHQFFQDHLAGRIANQISTLADNTERILHDLSRHIVRMAVLLIASFASMYWVHPTFFYGLFTWTVIFVGISMCWSKNIIHLADAHASAESVVSGELVDSITNATSVRIFARREHEMGYLAKALTFTKQAFQTKEKFLIKLHLLQGWSVASMLAFMLYYLIRLRAKELISIGDYALILGLSVEVGYMIWWTLEQVDELNKAIGKSNQSLRSLFVPLSIQDKEGASNLVVSKGQIAFSSVNFHYKDTRPLFQNLSITIEAGQKVGLVGYSGGGKSSFVNLILRLYDITGGRILIDGQDIRDVNQDSLRDNIAMIPQDPSLFHRTLMENIRYGRATASDEEVIEAAQKAYAHAFITQLPQGYDSLVGERGVKLSGGQRQRIAIARAILKDAPILILDEATSQLDSITEGDIQESLWQLMEGKTTLVIAHRLSTLLHMDRILVFEEGKIIEEGPHTTLLAAGGLYKGLWDAQVGGFLPDQKKKG